METIGVLNVEADADAGTDAGHWGTRREVQCALTRLGDRMGGWLVV